MKRVSTISRYLLAFVFTIFGLNGFLNFIPQPPPPSELAGQFLQVVTASHYMVPVFTLQLLCGILLLAGRFVPIALTVLAGIILNILTFHITMNLAGIGPGVFVSILWLLVFRSYKDSFRPLFRSHADPVN